MSKLSNKVAVVTGASKGIGAEIAKQLAGAGASVVVNYASSKEGADKVVAAITAAGGKAIAVQGDVSKQADIARLFEETKTAFGTLDILVNNAGVYAFAPLGQITEELFHTQFNLNVLGLLLTSQEAVKYFPEAGGNIINISSAVTTLYPPGSATYTATKASVDAITIILSKELGSKNIRVNAINPGMIETEGVHTAGFAAGEFRTSIEAQDAAWPYWPGGRHCSDCGVPCFVGLKVRYGSDDQRVWRHPLNVSANVRPHVSPSRHGVFVRGMPPARLPGSPAGRAGQRGRVIV